MKQDRYQISKIFYSAFFSLLIACILTNSHLSLLYAARGLCLWFDKMVPALLPFMILSGIMIRMNLTEDFSNLIYPVIHPLFQVSRNACYCMLVGFLCGFPMGAKTVAEMYDLKKISKSEAEYLLSFVNNIGPVYFLGYALPLLGRKLMLPYLAGMYLLPLLYGLILRYTWYRKKIPSSAFLPERGSEFDPDAKSTLLKEIDASIQSAGCAILSLGGYMILFNMLNLVPHLLFGHSSRILAPLLEINGGIGLYDGTMPLYILLLLPFGGLCCIAQTYSCIRETDLKITSYVLHKLLLTGLTALYYLAWKLFFPASFLQ